MSLPGVTVREALTEGSAALKSACLASPALDASLLLAELLGVGRASLAARGPDPLPAESTAAFRRLIERRLGGECVAYILGRKEFRGLDFAVHPAVLVPRPDTETLVEAALETMRERRAARGGEPAAGALNVLDLCAGSGAVAVALKHEMPELEVWAADISGEALETAKANAARLLPRNRYTPIRFRQGDLFDALSSAPECPGGYSFALIVSNPPYVPGAEIQNLSPEVQKEPRLALDGGGDGLDIIRNIIAGAPDFLCPGGALLLEADPSQMRAAAGLLETNGFIDIKTYRDLSNNERVIGGFRPGGAPLAGRPMNV
jgi:release factor glutamine methyltransferase